jgi:hypothetical protein
MPSRKQRRRRQKARRHDYEYVYVDEEGQEVEAEPGAEVAESPPARERKHDGNGRRDRGSAKAKPKRPRREYQPPSWKRSARRAALFLPLFFIVFSLVNRDASIASRLLASVGYSLLFIPLTYVMDRTAYRTFLRRSGHDSGPKRRGRSS